jgi:hypothetical protein
MSTRLSMVNVSANRTEMHDASTRNQDASSFICDEWVEVRGRAEILATLDENGRLDGLPFMPEMFEFCGQRFKVFKRAHKTCDPPSGLRGRRMDSAVHLEGVRCTGKDHGGCQAACLIFWKNAWLKKASDVSPRGATSAPDIAQSGAPGCSEATILANTRRSTDQADLDQPAYSCQSTQLFQATHPLHWWDMRQYVEDYTSGNVPLSRMFSSFIFFLWDQLATSGLGLGAGLRWAYDTFQKLRGATPYPARIGRIPEGTKTPSVVLNLQPGELVKVKKYEEILETLDEQGHNRGMWFDAEMVPYCGGTYRVLNRVNTIINEKTGRMQHMKNACIVLEDVACTSCYAKYRKFCPRSIFAYWREIWLERT